MGKKSRLKRERREAKEKQEMLLRIEDDEYTNNCNRLMELFSRYSAEDIIVSLSISDLWLPNISSQIKHTLAFVVASSMSETNFTSSERINSYADFRHFSQQLYDLLPSFPMLEDFMPEQDWGEIKYQIDNSLYRIFYGGSVERIPDFITAFLLLHENNNQAKLDMVMALAVQNHILGNIERTCVGEINDIHLGHIETPSENFWKKCSEALFSLSKNIDLTKVSEKLIGKFGETLLPTKEGDFVDGIFTGKTLPYFLTNLGGSYFPISLRTCS